MIKINNIKYSFIELPPEEHLAYLQIIETKINSFIEEILKLQMQYTETQTNYNTTVWTNIFLIPLFDLTDEATVSAALQSLETDKNVLTKFNSLYLELSLILPPKVMSNIKYNYHRTIREDFGINKNLSDYLEANYPFISLLHLISKKWWQYHLEINTSIPTT